MTPLLFTAGGFAAAPHREQPYESIRRTLLERYPSMKIVDVRPGPIPSLYEVFTGLSVVYTDKSGRYLITGSVEDTLTKHDLTEDRLNQRNAISFESLPFDQAIRIVRGSGQRKLAVFSDPDCPYCRRLERELQSVPDVTVYIFLFPIAALHPHAEAHAKAIWCASDRSQAWLEWMLERKEPPATTCDTDPTDALQSLGARLNIAGTPTLYFENGQRSSGAVSAKELEAVLAPMKKSKTDG